MKQGRNVRQEKELLFLFYNKSLQLYKEDADFIRNNYQFINSSYTPVDHSFKNREKLANELERFSDHFLNNHSFPNANIKDNFKEINDLLTLYNRRFERLAHLIISKKNKELLNISNTGFVDQLEKNPGNLSQADLLVLLKYENLYLVRNDEKSISDFNAFCNELTLKLNINAVKNAATREILLQYQTAFKKNVNDNKIIGFPENQGIWQELNSLQDLLRSEFNFILKEAEKSQQIYKKNEKLLILISIIYSILLGIFISLFTASKISQPFTALSSILKDTQSFNIDKSKLEKLDTSTEEVKVLTSTIENMADRINEQVKLINEKSEAIYKQNIKLQLSEKNLSESNKVKDKFFSIIAHDLRSPFATIQSFLQVLVNYTDGFSKNEIQSLAKDMALSMEGLSELLENLLEWSRSQMGNLDYKPLSFNVKDVVDKNISFIKLRASDKKIDLKSHIVEDFEIYADLNMIDFVFRNLLSNAIKFTNPNGKVEVFNKIIGDRIEFSIVDNGMGISMEDQRKLFNKEFKVTNLGTNSEKGTGLGLHLCKEFVEVNSGTIVMESALGKGTTIRFTIPISPPYLEKSKELIMNAAV
ncbi:hypothetical protein BH23BAC1_BH23BAC1_20840 [soil metagenome]